MVAGNGSQTLKDDVTHQSGYRFRNIRSHADRMSYARFTLHVANCTSGHAGRLVDTGYHIHPTSCIQQRRWLDGIHALLRGANQLVWRSPAVAGRTRVVDDWCCRRR